ncbi:hypothetical protein [Amycolatopsis sp.]|uniref:hypothetical protein n=1 Tax=Amycolatopsis sp. TaxID=37632 RepID=UPI002D7EFD53|nr:hypothetical protein [Amycolatopsis sp.]
MRIRQRRIVAVIGIVVGFLAAGVLPAQAAPVSSALPVAQSASVAAAEPSTSPAPARRVWVSVGEVHDCPTGYACATPTWGSNGGWEFQFYNYGTYSLANFTGDSGSVSNSQTGNAGMRLLDQSGRVIRCQWAGTGDYVNWDPVWYIQLSATPC